MGTLRDAAAERHAADLMSSLFLVRITPHKQEEDYKGIDLVLTDKVTGLHYNVQVKSSPTGCARFMRHIDWANNTRWLSLLWVNGTELVWVHQASKLAAVMAGVHARALTNIATQAQILAIQAESLRMEQKETT
jgi:hypothetical protein